MICTFFLILNLSSSSSSTLDKKRENVITFLPAPSIERTGGSSDTEKASLSISVISVFERKLSLLKVHQTLRP